MNDSMAQEIKLNLDNPKQFNDDLINEKLTVKVDKGFLNMQNTITNELIEIGFNDFYRLEVESLKRITKLIRRVDFNRPNQKTLSAKFIKLPLAADLYSPATCLYQELLFAIPSSICIQKLLKRIDELENDLQQMILHSDFSSSNAFNKTALLSQMEGLKQIKMSTLKLQDIYNLIINTPAIKRFMYYWKRYYDNDFHFPVVCIVNDEAYKFDKYKDMLKINNITIFEQYDRMLRFYKRVKKNSKTKLDFEFNGRGALDCLLFDLYMNNTFGQMNNCVSDLEVFIKGKVDKTTDIREIETLKSELVSLGLIRSEFIKFEKAIRELITSKHMVNLLKSAKYPLNEFMALEQPDTPKIDHH